MGSGDHRTGLTTGRSSVSSRDDKSSAIALSRARSQTTFKKSVDLFRADDAILKKFKTSASMSAGLKISPRPEAAASDAEPEILPLTVAQRGIWIGSKISRVGTIFNIAEAVEIHGVVDPDLFVEAIRQVIAEAQTTRVNIFEDADGPHQIVRERYRGATPFMDFSKDAAPDAAAKAWMMADVTAPCDMERDALWFGALAKTAEDRFFLYQRAHHIVLDGFAGGLLVRRIAEIYNATSEGRPSPPSPFAPLRTLIEEEKSYRASKAFVRDRQYWLDRLDQFPDPVSLAQGRAPSANGLARETVRLTPETADALRAFAKAEGCSLPQILIALMAGFIHRTTGARDLVLGMPVSARNKAARCVPGMVANGIMLRLDIDPEADFRTLAAQVAKEVRRSLRHQHYRFEDMRRDLGLTGQHDHLARVAVNIEPFDYNLTFGGAPTTAHNLANSSVEDMVIFIYERGDGADLRIDFDANPSLYSATELRDHRQRFEQFCGALLKSPGAALENVELLSEQERQRLLNWGRGERRFLPDAPVFQLIEQQAARAPQAVAVRYNGKSLTYGELNARANGFARRLLAAGVGRGDIIALALPRSELFPIAILGIAKAGAAYLPIDPCDPPTRIKRLLEDAQAKMIIAETKDAPVFDAGDCPVWRAEDCLANEDTVNINDHERGGTVNARDLAYLIYTSGSTGEPKGVMLHHGGLTNTVCDAMECFPLTADDRLVAVAPFTFDASVIELHTALAAGAIAIIAPQKTIRDPAALSGLMQREAASFMIATPTLWSMLISSRSILLQGIKAGVAGEALTPRLARALHDLGAKVANYYGPTETTVQCVVADIGEENLAAPPIGKPILNADAYILDERLNLAPAGVAGELCIAGAGVALGYLNNPALTAEKFPVNPFDPEGGRLYRTGDLARWREDGMLEFLGRRDQQIKVRGVRIEPGEIEAALLACDGVKAAFVDAIENPKGGKSLAAYVIADGDVALDEKCLRDAVSQTLSSNATPSKIFILDAVPMTRSGKIDRNALPKTSGQTSSGYVAPRTSTEQKLAEIFKEMLGLERIGVEDNFFELGADSLTAVQLLVEIETQFSTQLSLLSLFDAPTIANLAREMDDADASDPFETVFPLRRHGEETPLFCIHSIVGVAWSYAGLLRHLSPHCPVYGLQARGLKDDASPLPDSIDAMAEDYLREIRAIRPHGPYRLMGWSLGGLVAQSVAAKLEAAGEKVEGLFLLDSFPFSPSLGAVGDESALVDIALQFVHQPGDAMGARTKTLASLADYMFAAFDVFSMPLIEKAGIDGAAARQRFQRVIENCFRITLSHRPPKIAADIHIFRAEAGRTSSLDGVIEQAPGAWRAYTSGEARETGVACGHFEILNPGPLETIGPAVRDLLR